MNYIPKENTKIEKYKQQIYKKEYSIILKLFQGIQITKIRRMENNKLLSEIPEMFFIIQLSVPDEMNCTIEMCIDNYCSVEVLDKENQYVVTDNIDKKIDALKNTCFYELPQILILSLKRFGNNIQRKKNIVVLDEELDLDKHCQSGNNKYELYGINLHIGNIGGGHYMAAIKNKDWYLMNDTSVSKINFNTLKENYKAYCLFYRKKK